MKFGGKQTMADKMSVARARVGKNPGVKADAGGAKGTDWKAKPKISKKDGGTIGVTFTKKTGRRK